MLQGTTAIMIVASLIFLGLLWWFRKEFETCKLCFLFLFVGALGNLIDRTFRGYVVDFIDLGWFPVFNISDALITFGAVGVIWLLIKEIINKK
jgi:signal peptidase II